MVQREGMTGGALFAVRRDHRDLTDLFSRANEAIEAMGQDPVVVGAEETHRT
jgi:hypothetical protein